MVDINDTSTRATSAYISLNEITVNWNSIGQLILYGPDFFFLPYFNKELIRGRWHIDFCPFLTSTGWLLANCTLYIVIF